MHVRHEGERQPERGRQQGGGVEATECMPQRPQAQRSEQQGEQPARTGVALGARQERGLRPAGSGRALHHARGLVRVGSHQHSAGGTKRVARRLKAGERRQRGRHLLGLHSHAVLGREARCRHGERRALHDDLVPTVPARIEVPVIREHHGHGVRAARRRVQRRDQPVGARERLAVLLTANAQLVRRLVHGQHVHQGDALGLGSASQVAQRPRLEARAHRQHVGVGRGRVRREGEQPAQALGGIDAAQPSAARAVEERVGPGGGAAWARLEPVGANAAGPRRNAREERVIGRAGERGGAHAQLARGAACRKRAERRQRLGLVGAQAVDQQHHHRAWLPGVALRVGVRAQRRERRRRVVRALPRTERERNQQPEPEQAQPGPDERRLAVGTVRGSRWRAA